MDDITPHISDSLDAEFVPSESGVLTPQEQKGALTAPQNPPEACQKKIEAEADFQRGRRLLDLSVDKMEKALQNMDVLGSQMETAGFWDSYAKMFCQSGQLAKDLMELHQKKDSLAAFVDSTEDDQTNQINIENAVVYTGNTADMQRQLKRQKEDDIEGESVSGKPTGTE